ncbi:hypothetical protein [Clostridium sp.]|uniref:hypothetical protein n=1 Tax=Clostridium sp. TaxID=1506 RepID=UPI001A487CC4|nr:hypothetical protein [Clostridium sp.]MBK5237194.1 hypothetical protein [Clostridium sp.]
MNNIQNIKLSIFLYRYLNQDKILNKNRNYKSEKKIDIDYTFKENLKQHFRTLTLIDENNKCNI